MVQAFIFGPVLADVFCSETASSKILIGLSFSLTVPNTTHTNCVFFFTDFVCNGLNMIHFVIKEHIGD